jgi:hypothetical protein
MLIFKTGSPFPGLVSFFPPPPPPPLPTRPPPQEMARRENFEGEGTHPPTRVQGGTDIEPLSVPPCSPQTEGGPPGPVPSAPVRVLCSSRRPSCCSAGPPSPGARGGARPPPVPPRGPARPRSARRCASPLAPVCAALGSAPPRPSLFGIRVRVSGAEGEWGRVLGSRSLQSASPKHARAQRLPRISSEAARGWADALSAQRPLVRGGAEGLMKPSLQRGCGKIRKGV